MNLKNKVGLLIAGAVFMLAGLNLIIDSASTKNAGALMALAGVSTDILVLLLFIKQGKWLSKI